MGLGNANASHGDKGSNFRYELGVLKVLNKILAALGGGTGSDRIHTTLSTVIAGTIPAGTVGGSVINIGNEDGTWNSTTLPPGVSIPWREIVGDSYTAISYDPTGPGTGTTFLIEYST
jgi:hypothetical protein